MAKNIACMLLMLLSLCLGMAFYGVAVSSYCSGYLLGGPEAEMYCWEQMSHPFAIAFAAIPVVGLILLSILATMTAVPSDDEDEESYD